MSTTEKTYNKVVDSSKLRRELAEVFNETITIRVNNENTTVLFEVPKSTTQWNEVQSIVDSHEMFTLDDLKRNKNWEIDQKTQALIYKGIDYDLGGSDGIKNFSLTLTAQHNLDAIGGNFTDNLLHAMKSNNIDIDTAYPIIESSMYPARVSLTDGGFYSFQDHDSLMNFKNAAFGKIKEIYNNGQDLRVLVNACTNIADLEAITDDR